jgi:hypothetical protein
LIICDQLEAQDSSKHGIISLSQKQRFGKIVAKMMLKPERCWVVWILFSSVTQIVQDYFQSRCIKGEANGSRTFLQQVVLKPHEQAANVFINLQVPRLKQ